MDSARTAFGSLLLALLEAWEERPLVVSMSLLRLADVVWACAGAAMPPAMRAAVTAIGVTSFVGFRVSIVCLSAMRECWGWFSLSLGTQSRRFSDLFHL